MRQPDSYDQWQHREEARERREGHLQKRQQADFEWAGQVDMKVAPTSASEATETRPRCADTSRLDGRQEQSSPFECESQPVHQSPSRIGLRQRGEEQAWFYCSGTCICGCSRGDHDYPVGPCMNSGCGCKAFTLRSASEAA